MFELERPYRKPVRREPTKQRCHRCHGTGQAPCRSCGGSGKIPTSRSIFGEQQFARCSACFGKKTMRCGTCAGVGYLV